MSYSGFLPTSILRLTEVAMAFGNCLLPLPFRGRCVLASTCRPLPADDPLPDKQRPHVHRCSPDPETRPAGHRDRCRAKMVLTHARIAREQIYFDVVADSFFLVNAPNPPQPPPPQKIPRPLLPALVGC